MRLHHTSKLHMWPTWLLQYRTESVTYRLNKSSYKTIVVKQPTEYLTCGLSKRLSTALLRRWSPQHDEFLNCGVWCNCSHCKCRMYVVPMQVCLTSPGSRWWSYTVQSARMFTRPSLRDTTTQTAHTSALGSHTCSSWCTRSTGQRDHQTSSSPGMIPLLQRHWLFLLLSFSQSLGSRWPRCPPRFLVLTPRCLHRLSPYLSVSHVLLFSYTKYV